jgi:hypothetical protein
MLTEAEEVITVAFLSPHAVITGRRPELPVL